MKWLNGKKGEERENDIETRNSRKESLRKYKLPVIKTVMEL